jgi:hypothetical protein
VVFGTFFYVTGIEKLEANFADFPAAHHTTWPKPIQNQPSSSCFCSLWGKSYEEIFILIKR